MYKLGIPVSSYIKLELYPTVVTILFTFCTIWHFTYCTSNLLIIFFFFLDINYNMPKIENHCPQYTPISALFIMQGITFHNRNIHLLQYLLKGMKTAFPRNKNVASKSYAPGDTQPRT